MTRYFTVGYCFGHQANGGHRPDEEILRALAYRAVDPVQAAKLLDHLHHGRKPESQPRCQRR